MSVLQNCSRFRTALSRQQAKLLEVLMAEGSIVIPPTLRGLRACLRCKMVKTEKQFQDGCANCDEESFEPETHTTPVFHGLLALTEPKSSWVAKWHGLDNFVPGLYALSVVGSLSAAADR